MIEWLIIGSLITWRLSSLLVHEEGPFDVFGKLRDLVGVRFDDRSQKYSENLIGQILCCIWCTSIWIGWFVAALVNWQTAAWMGFAYSAGAIVVDRLVRR